ncbi:MAG: hypothetical protein D6800_11020 [Candidatus Zixiibacteriota bacterium]|nr:MAG: hypothetical protein D6800_11020 [candidate division Zixibacteria bacterium]
MAAVDIKKADVFQGRLVELTINSSTPSEVFARKNIREGIVKVSEEIEEAVYETESVGVDVDEGIRSRKVLVELEISEISTTDIDNINTSGAEIIVKTSTGGANGTGKTLTVSSCDAIFAHLNDLKTKIVARKKTTGATLGFSIADNA